MLYEGWVFVKHDIVKKTLDNGLRTVFVKNNNNKVVIVVSVGVGLSHENPEITGVSHFLEHVLWKGSNSKNGKEIRDAVRKMNGEYNAFTSFGMTTYYIAVPRKHFDEALELLSSVITRPGFDEEEINKEKRVILNELTRFNDNPFFNLDHRAREELFKGNMIGLNIGGSNETVKKINKEMLEQHYGKYYTSNNMVVAVNGNIKDPIEKIQKLFNLQPKFIPEPKNFEQKSTFPIEIVEQTNTSASYVELAFQTVGFNSKESDALELIREMLDEGKELNLMEEIRYKYGLTYHVHLINHNLKETGIFVIGLSTEKTKTEESIQLIKNQLQKIQNVTKQELENSKKRLLKMHKVIMNDKDQQFHTQVIANCELNNNWNDYTEHDKKIKTITTEEIKNTAKQYLENNYVQVTLKQKEGEL